jgi:hypothetical protein
VTLTPDEVRRLDRLARGLRHDDPQLARLLTTGRSGRSRRRVPVLGVVLAAVVLGGSGIVVVAQGCSGGGIVPVLLGAALIGSCFAAITWLTAAPRGRRAGQAPSSTARRAARAPSVWSRSRWRR